MAETAKEQAERVRRLTAGEANTPPEAPQEPRVDLPKGRVGLSTPEKAAIYHYAAQIAFKLRPDTKLPSIGDPVVTTDTPVEAQRRLSDYNDRYHKAREAADNYAVHEAKVLWRKLFNEEI